jgi:predicted short-subunit dehydrogenase-like oxidoreductase (DUF2520 family)
VPDDVLAQSLVLAGPGRAGAAFARSWRAAGGSIARLIGRDAAKPLPAGLEGTPRASADSPGPACDVLVLAVPDDAIAQVAAELAPRLSCGCVIHLSGALSSEVLKPFADRGAAVASVHPVRPFTGAPGEDWRGAFVAIEGDPSGAALGDRIARAVGARPHSIAPGAKPLYHASASLAAGGAAAVLAVAVRGWVDAGIPEDVAREALSALAVRAVDAVGHRTFPEAFTGAVARRDVGTVKAHAEALAGRTDVLVLYRTLANEILERTPGRGKESEIRRILADAAARR